MRKSKIAAALVFAGCAGTLATGAVLSPSQSWAAQAAASPSAMTAAPTIRVLTPAQAQQDVALMRRALETIHPGLYRRASKKDMNAAFAQLEQATRQPISEAELYRRISLTLAMIRCNHTKAEQAPAIETWRRDNPSHLPFRFRLLEGRMIVESSDPSQPGLPKGAEILSINGRPVTALIEMLGAYVPIDGDTEWSRTTNLASDGDLMGSDFDHFYPYVFGFTSSFDLVVRKSAEAETSRLQMSAASFKTWRALPWDGDRYRSNLSDTTSWRMLDRETAYLRIITFVNYRQPVDPQEFYGKIFSEINTAGAKRLILDLRDNGGGSSDATYGLLDFLTTKPFVWNKQIRFQTVRIGDIADFTETWGDRTEAFFPPLTRFTALDDGGFALTPLSAPDELTPRTPAPEAFAGPITVLTSPVNGSGSTMLIAKLRDLGRARLVGGRSGGSGDGPTAGQIYNVKLPNSAIAVRVPNAFNAMQVSRFERNGGVTPDVLVEQTVDDYRAGRDTVLEAALADRRAPMAASAALDATQLFRAISGGWRGTLEYRDFTSDRRVTLPTTLEANLVGDGKSVQMSFTYDDGPGKTVRDGYSLSVDLNEAILSKSKDNDDDRFRIISAASLEKPAPFTWTLWGRGTENGEAVDVKETLTVTRTHLTLLRETKAKDGDFAFRHAYRFTRART